MSTSGSRTKQVLKAMVAELIFQILSVLFPFVIRSIFIIKFGRDYVGLNSLCTSILSTLNLIELGMDASFKYKMFKPMAEKDWDKVGSILNYIKSVYFVIGLIIMGLGGILMPFLPVLIKSGTPSGINVYVVFGGYLLQQVLGYFYNNYLRTAFIADQQKHKISIFQSVTFMFVYIVQTVVILEGKYYLYIVSLVLFPIVMGFLLGREFKKCYPKIDVNGKLENDIKGEIWRETTAVAVFRLRTASRDTFDNIIISALLGLAILADYNNYILISALPCFLCKLVAVSVGPSLGNFQVHNSKKEIYRIYRLSLLLQLFFSALMCVCYYSLAQNFIIVWIGEEYILDRSVAALTAYQIFFRGISEFTTMLRESLGIWNKGRYSALCEMLSNLVLNIVFTKFWGLNGIIIATIVTIVLFNVPTDMMNIIREHLNEKVAWSHAIIINVVIGATLGTYLSECIMGLWGIQNGWISLGIRAFICLVVSSFTMIICLIPVRDFRQLLMEGYRYFIRVRKDGDI